MNTTPFVPGPDPGNEFSQPPRVRVSSPGDILAVVPHLLGFHPARSLVVVGARSLAGEGRCAEGVSSPSQRSRGPGVPGVVPRESRAGGRPPGGAQQIELAFRYDLPDPPDAATAAELAGHAAAVLAQRRLQTVIGIGYGPGVLVTPVADALATAVRERGLRLHELMRVEDGRYWSYICANPDCCPPEGVRFDVQASPAAAAMTVAGLVAYPDRAALAGTLAPVTGVAARTMQRATIRARARAAKLVSLGTRGRLDPPATLLAEAGRRAVRDFIASYRAGRPITEPDQVAWLSVTLAHLPVRDDAWARMDPAHRDAHLRMWSDVVRRARPAYLAAPAALLAFTAWQSGEGALANIALDRALAADPGYSLAHLLRDILDAGVPPSEARLPMTPEQVADSYSVAAAALPPGPPPGRRVPKRRDLGTSGGKPGSTAR
jgi:hypothetical protein